MHHTTPEPRPRTTRLSALRRFAASWRPLHYAILLLAQAQLLSSGAKAGDSDWYDFIYPWADALRVSIVKYHEFPWWNPWSISGQPFFAEPQTAVLTPDTLFIVLFGAVVGYKLVILFYGFVGYEGSRFVCRELFGASRLVEGASIIPALLPPLALHLAVGHAVLISFWAFPWLFGLALCWQRSAARALAFGLVAGFYFLTYIHYSIIIGYSIAGSIVLVQLLGAVRAGKARETLLKAALVVCAALGTGIARMAMTIDFVRGFPRAETMHYPIVGSLSEVLRTLIEPLQNLTTAGNVAELGWWELGSYVGIIALLLAYEGFRRGARRLRWLGVGALLCLVFAWNNRDPYLPGYWMHVIPPFSSMVVITRWRLFACYLLLLSTVQGLTVLRSQWLSALLAASVVLDLGFHIHYAYRGTFEREAPAWQPAPDPPLTLRDRPDDVWRNFRQNRVSMGTEFPLLGWRDHYPSRDYVGMPNYRGDYVGTKPVRVETWTPNRVVLTGTPGDTLSINVNPSSYWRANGEQLFPRARAMEPNQPFRLTLPASGRVELSARPPHAAALFLLQATFFALALVLFRLLRRREHASHAS